jgi:RimJ/RimL family protein N-acetyltransferase
LDADYGVLIKTGGNSVILPIRTQRLYIAEFEENMAESVHKNSLDEDNRRFVPDEVFETVEDASKTVSALISFYARDDAPLVYPIFLNDGQHIGHVQAVPIGNVWEVGYHVTKPFAGNGYATEAVGAFLQPIMRRLGITQIYGICRADNIASRRVLEKCKFTLEYEGLAPYHGAEYPICRYLLKAFPPKRDGD